MKKAKTGLGAVIKWIGVTVLLCSCSAESKEGVWLNHDPAVKYVGQQRCISCHDDIHASFKETGMGRSFYKPDPLQMIESFGPEVAVTDVHSGYQYHPFWKGKEMFLLEFRMERNDTVYRRTEKIDYIVGSGHQTRSYLLDRGGFFYEAPITWYVQAGKWDLSPGYEQGKNSRFSREIGLECMACHNSRPDFAVGTENFFRSVGQGIDCESCHGPGELHIRKMEAGQEADVGLEADPSIVNPARLPVALQFDVCMQCHLQGLNVYQPGKSILDFRPGMPLTSVMNVVVEEPTESESFGIASHAQRLMESTCFIQSGEKLTCTTCHDPHHSLKTNTHDAYRNSCLSCHSEGKKMCSERAELRNSSNDNCAGCHMRKGGTSDIPHVTFTDHRIRILSDSTPPAVSSGMLKLICATQKQAPDDIMARAWLLYFERNSPDPALLERVEGKLGEGNHFEKASLHYYKGRYEEALREINVAVQAFPDDAWIAFRKGEILEALGRVAEASAVYAEAFRKHPDAVDAGLKSGVLRLKSAAGNEKALAECRELFGQLLRRKPFDEKILSNLGFTEMNQGDFKLAESHFRQALQTDPDYLLARENLVLMLAHEHRMAEARAELALLIAQHPGYPKIRLMQDLVK
jgi:tetratricopeptide (TPR) repeat protein